MSDTLDMENVIKTAQEELDLLRNDLRKMNDAPGTFSYKVINRVKQDIAELETKLRALFLEQE